MPMDGRRTESQPTNPRRAAHRWPGLRHQWWIVRMMAVVLCGAGCAAGLSSPALAQAADAQQPPAAQQAYDIAAGPLAPALRSLASSAGLLLTFTAQQTDGKTTAGIRGRYSPQKALAALLASTGLQAVQLDNGGYVLRESKEAVVPDAKPTVQQNEATLSPVTVTATIDQETATGPVQGYAATRSATGMKADMLILETPQSISVVTSEQIATLRPQNLERALSYSAGIVPMPGFSDVHDMVLSRGFAIEASTGNVYRDGLKLSNNSWGIGKLEPYGAERIELLRGPSSVLYGAMTPAGLLNIVTKRPSADLLKEINVELGSFDHKQISTDLGGALVPGGEFTWRLTALGRDSDTFTDYVPDDALYVAPALKWQPSASTSLTLLAHYQETHGAHQTQLPAIGTLDPSIHGKIPRKRFTGEPGYDGQDMRQIAIGYLFEHAFSDSTRLRQSLRYINSDNEVPYTLLGEADPDDPNPDDPRLYTRYPYDQSESVHGVSADLSLEQRWQTGPVMHTFVAGIDYSHFNLLSKWDERTMPSLDVYDPVYGAQVGFGTEWSRYGLVSDRTGLYLQDQMKIHDRWVLLLGGRQDWVVDRTELAGSWGMEPDTRERSDAFTGRIGGVYLAANGLAPFISFSQSFEPQSGVDSQNRRFDPTKGEQYEAGLRYQPPGAKWLFSTSIYQITQTNVLTMDPVDPVFSKQTGEVRSRGVELEAKGEILSGLAVIAAYAYTDAHTTRSEDPEEVGQRPVGIPYHQASLWGDYRFRNWGLPMLHVGLGARYVGHSPSPHAGGTPSYVVMDMLAAIEQGRWRLALNVDNLADKTYATIDPAGYAHYGEPRRLRLTLSHRW